MDLESIAKVSYQREMAIISLICNLEATSEILAEIATFSELEEHTGADEEAKTRRLSS